MSIRVRVFLIVAAVAAGAGLAGLLLAALYAPGPAPATSSPSPVLAPSAASPQTDRSPLPPTSVAALFDHAPPFPGYAWTRNGSLVDGRELSTIAGPAHCSWESATMLQIGWPPGTVAESGALLRMYIRDPRGVMRRDFQQRLVLGARLPSDARPTGYRFGAVEVYVSPSDQDEAIYLVGPDGAERWPRSDPLTLCQ